MPNIFETIKADKAPTNVGANSVNEPIKLYKPDAASMQRDVLSNEGGTRVFTGTVDDYDSLASYGAQPNVYQSQTDLEKIRAKNQSAWKQASNSLAQAVGTVAGDMIGGMGMLVDIATGGLWDDKLFSNPITELGDFISDKTRELFPIYRENPEKAFDMDDFSGWFFSQLPSVASSLSLMIPGTAFAKGVGIIGKGLGMAARSSSKLSRAMNAVQRITKLDNTYNAMRAQTLIKDGLTSIGMRLGENYQEARGVAEQIQNEAFDLFAGMSPDEMQKWIKDNPDIAKEANGDVNEMARIIAEKASMRDFSYNALNVVFDYMQLRAVNKMFGQVNRAITPRLRYAQNQALDRIAATGVESTSQTLGQAAKSTITGIGGKLNRLINSSENLLISELSEGIEEAINYVGQEEGTAYGRYLLGQLEDYDNSFVSLDRIKNYIRDPQLYNSALWGVLGGIMFGGTMSAIRNRKGGLSEEKMRIAEISGREQLFNSYKEQMSAINNGINPFEVERDSNDNIIYYMDDGTVSADPSVGTPRNVKLNPEEQETMANEARSRFASALTLNAIRAGNYELLQDYINDPRLKKKLIDNGLAEEATYEQDTVAINEEMENTLNKYKTYSTALRSANVEDALLDIAISENIFNANEAELLDKRIQKIESLQNELENSIPELANIVDPIVKNRIILATLEQYRKDANIVIKNLETSRANVDKITMMNYKDVLNTLESKIKDVRELLSPADRLFADVIHDNYNKELGLPTNDILDSEIEKFRETEENAKLFEKTIEDFNIKKIIKNINSINSEYLDNMQLLISHEIQRDNFRKKIANTNESIKKKEKEIKDALEKAKKFQLDTSKNIIYNYLNNSNGKEADFIGRLLDNNTTEEDNKRKEYEVLKNAIDTIKASSEKDSIFKDIKTAINRIKIHEEKVDKLSKIKVEMPNEFNNNNDSLPFEPSTSSTNYIQHAVQPTVTPTPKTKEEEQLKNTLDKLVNTSNVNIVTNANIEDFKFKIINPFASLHYMNQTPVKVNSIRVEKSRFGNLSISGYDKNKNLIADVTIEEINAAIANGDIEATSNSSSDEGNVLESAIQDLDHMRQRLEEIKLIIDLYNKINGNTINDKTFTSINDMMVYLQRLNPNAISLFNDIKVMANNLIADGKIISTDTEYKSTGEIVSESKRTIKEAIAEKNKEDNNINYYFDLINLDNAKVYTQIGKLKTGNTVSVELQEDGKLLVKSRGLIIGELPTLKYINGNPTAINKGWTYTIKSKRVPFIEELISIVKSKDDASKEFLSTLNNIRRLFKVRNNPDIEATFGHLLNTLQDNQIWKRLDSLYSADTDIITKVKHLNSIIFFDYNVELNTPYFDTIVSDSLNTWMNKIIKSYSDINNLRSSLNNTNSKKKRLTISTTSTGSLIYAKDGRGNPIYNNIADVTTVDATNGFQLVRGGDNAVIDIKTGQAIEASGIKRGIVGIVVRDSEGRLMTASTRENTMDNGFTKGTTYTQAFNEGIDTLFNQLLKATHSGNVQLHDALLKEIDRYIGAGKPLFGYRVQGNALVPNIGRDAPTIWFNVNQDNPSVRFVYPNGTKYTLSAFMPGTRNRPTNTDANFAKAMTGVYSTITRNVINTALNNESDMFRMNEGKLEARIPNLDKDVWIDTGYTSYEEFVAKDGVVVTDLGAIRNKKGDIISNFNYVNDRFNKRITLVNPTRNRSQELAPSSPVGEQTSSPSITPNPNLTTDTISGTISEIAATLTDNQQLLDVVSALEQAGLTVNPNIEVNENRLASILPGTNQLTVTTLWQKLDNTQKVLKIIHEGVHFLLNDERANIEQSFGDIYDTFANTIKSDTTLSATYGKYLKEGSPRQVQIEEFVTEALTSRELARLLATMKYKGETNQVNDNLFTKIVNAIVDIIGKINANLDGTMLGEIRNRLSTITNETVTNDGTTMKTITDISNIEEDTSVPLGEDTDIGIPDFTDIEGIDLLDSAIIDNYNQVDDFNSYIEGLTARKRAIITHLFDTGELSFVCN